MAAQLQLSDKTIGNYIASIFSKLCVKRRMQVVAWYLKQAHSDEFFLDNLVQSLGHKVDDFDANSRTILP
ncbi:MAG: response regulator transcription factor [Nitrospira sp.]|nr:response regulator transcription factor [Nitrospira sp.]